MNEIKVELQDWMGNDRAIAEAAWTSSNDFVKKQARTDDDVRRIVNMLAELKHSVPFESVVFRFWIKMPIQTDRQHMTHRIASHSGMSGRYRTMPSEWLSADRSIREILASSSCDLETTLNHYEQTCDNANLWYTSLLERLKQDQKDGLITNSQYKRAREFFRGVLPQNNITERVTVMNLRSFANYYRLRSKADAQLEIQYIAQQMHRQIELCKVCPLAFEALDKNGWTI